MATDKKKFLSEPMFRLCMRYDKTQATLLPLSLRFEPTHTYTTGTVILLAIGERIENKLIGRQTNITALPFLLHTDYSLPFPSLTQNEIRYLLETKLDWKHEPKGSPEYKFWRRFVDENRKNRHNTVRLEQLLVPVSGDFLDRVDTIKFVIANKISIVYKYKDTSAEHIADLSLIHSAILDKKKHVITDFFTPVFISDEDKMINEDTAPTTHYVPTDDETILKKYSYDSIENYCGNNRLEVMTLLDSITTLATKYIPKSNRQIYYPTLYDKVFDNTNLARFRTQQKITFKNIGIEPATPNITALPLITQEIALPHDSSIDRKTYRYKKKLFLPTTESTILQILPLSLPRTPARFLEIGKDDKIHTYTKSMLEYSSLYNQ